MIYLIEKSIYTLLKSYSFKRFPKSEYKDARINKYNGIFNL